MDVTKLFISLMSVLVMDSIIEVIFNDWFIPSIKTLLEVIF